MPGIHDIFSFDLDVIHIANLLDTPSILTSSFSDSLLERLLGLDDSSTVTMHIFV